MKSCLLLGLAVVRVSATGCTDIKSFYQDQGCCSDPEGNVSSAFFTSPRTVHRYPALAELFRCLYADLDVAVVNSEIKYLGYTFDMEPFVDEKDFVQACMNFNGYQAKKDNMRTLGSSRFPDENTLAMYIDSFPSTDLMYESVRLHPSYQLTFPTPYRSQMSNGAYILAVMDSTVDPFTGWGFSTICQLDAENKPECLMIDILEGSSANTSGIKKGDYVIAFNGADISLTNIPPPLLSNTRTVQLTVQTLGEEPRNVSVSAGPLDEANYGISHKIYETPDSKIGYVLYRYQTQAFQIMYRRLSEIYREFIAKGVDRVIMDLRGDVRGGDPDYAVMRAAINGKSSFAGMPEFTNGFASDLWQECTSDLYKSNPFSIGELFGIESGLPGLLGPPSALYNDEIIQYFNATGGVPFLNETGRVKSVDVLQSPYQGSGPEYSAAIAQQIYGSTNFGDETLGLNHLGTTFNYLRDGKTVVTFAELVSNCHQLFDTRRGGLEPDEYFEGEYFSKEHPFDLGNPEKDPLLAHVLTLRGATIPSRRRLSSASYKKGSVFGVHSVLKLPRPKMAMSPPRLSTP